MKLYYVSDGPPSLSVMMLIKHIGLSNCSLVSIDFIKGEHMTEEYAKMNPQKEIPVLEDDGFFLSESIAILQYLCNKYAPEDNIYPKDAKCRAIVDQRLCFNMTFYYSSISQYAMGPIFFDYERTPLSLKKLQIALQTFETYLQRFNTKYAAGDELTISDFPLITATMCLEAINFNIDTYPLICKWYKTFKEEYPNLWEVAEKGMKEIAEFEKNPPNMSSMNHPIHPTRKMN